MCWRPHSWWTTKKFCSERLNTGDRLEPLTQRYQTRRRSTRACGQRRLVQLDSQEITKKKLYSACSDKRLKRLTVELSVWRRNEGKEGNLVMWTKDACPQWKGSSQAPRKSDFDSVQNQSNRIRFVFKLFFLFSSLSSSASSSSFIRNPLFILFKTFWSNCNRTNLRSHTKFALLQRSVVGLVTCYDNS